MNARSSYVENAVRGASPVGLIVVLYDQIVEDLRRAVTAMERRQIDGRTNAINHALLIIGQLQGRLNHEAGGQVAANLDRFYDVIRQNLIQAQVQQSKPLLLDLIAALLEVRSAWHEADRTQGIAGSDAARPAADPAEVSAGAARLDWEG